ncbi:NADH dehydrogenase [ubiquinone] 1 alpha subcomplex subunit 7 [Tyrophagus putrescentiae]|nr:NADH dehydrogenase [ubiquinone] 1 alpha subcomplex subunit 7 [Tyrophagus putrescentiae]
MTIYRRDVGPVLQVVRAILLGRSWNFQNRYQDFLAPRPYPKPDLTGGVAHKASDNHYCLRDARRAVLPTHEIPLKQLGDGQAQSALSGKVPTPGPAYRWD